MRYLLALALLGTSITLTFTHALPALAQAQAQYDAELSCVAKHISLGTERINIGTKDGTCYVAPNAYYSN